MSLLYRIRKIFGEYLLNKELLNHKRDRSFQSFQASKTIGILFNATYQEDLELMKKYVKYLRDSKKKVKVIGYFDIDEVPDATYSKIEYDFISNKELNWQLKPIKSFVSNFIKEEYDILIDCNLNDDFPLKYISTLSKAKFKIGKNSQDGHQFDLMIETTDQTGLKSYMKNVDHYLLQIKSKPDTQALDNVVKTTN